MSLHGHVAVGCNVHLIERDGYGTDGNGKVLCVEELALHASPDRTSNGEDKGETGVKESRTDIYTIPALESKPPNYMWLAICTTIFFNPLSGVVALVLARQADAEYLRHNCEQARRLGRAVKILCVISIVITVVILVIMSSFFVTPPVLSAIT